MDRRSFLKSTAGAGAAAIGVAFSEFKPKTPQDSWLEEELVPARDLVDGAHGASDTVLHVDEIQYHQVGDLIHVPRTVENMWVSAADTRGLHVVRGVGTVPAAVVDRDVIWTLGSFERVSG